MTKKTIDGPARTAGENAEWDRNRAEEDPVLWELAMTDKAHREELAKSPPYDVLEKKVAAACEEQGVPMIGADEFPDEVEPCQERLAYPDGNRGGSACDPRWGRDSGWYCGNCKAAVLIMRAVPVPVPDVIEAVKEPERGVVNMRSRTQWKEKWGG